MNDIVSDDPLRSKIVFRMQLLNYLSFKLNINHNSY